MADEEQQQPPQKLPLRSPTKEQQPELEQSKPSDIAPEAAEAEAEQQAEDNAAPADEAEGTIDAAPATDQDNLTTVVRGENTEAAARTAAIFDEDDEDQDQSDLPSFRRHDARDASNPDDPDAAIIRKKKKKRHHSPDAPAAARHASGEREMEPEQEDGPYANMTEAESKFNTTPEQGWSIDRCTDALALAMPLLCSPTSKNGQDDRRSFACWKEEGATQACR